MGGEVVAEKLEEVLANVEWLGPAVAALSIGHHESACA